MFRGQDFAISLNHSLGENHASATASKRRKCNYPLHLLTEDGAAGQAGENHPLAAVQPSFRGQESAIIHLLLIVEEIAKEKILKLRLSSLKPALSTETGVSGANGQNAASPVELEELHQEPDFATNLNLFTEDQCAEGRIPNPSLATSNHAPSMVDGAAGDNGLSAVPLVLKEQLPGRGHARIQSLHMEEDLARAMIPKVKHAT